MIFGRLTTLSAVLLAIRTQAVTAGSWITLPYVALSIEEAWKPDEGLPATAAVAIQRFRGRSVAADVAGGGNEVQTFDCTVDVVLWLKLDVDDAGRDLVRLTDATLGIIAKWTNLLKALNLFKPLHTPSGECILEEPMRCLDFDVRPVSLAGWCSIVTPFQFMFRQDLT